MMSHLISYLKLVLVFLSNECPALEAGQALCLAALCRFGTTVGIRLCITTLVVVGVVVGVVVVGGGGRSGGGGGTGGQGAGADIDCRGSSSGSSFSPVLVSTCIASRR